MPLPYAMKGTGPTSRNPKLLPNFDKSVMTLHGNIDHVAPADYLTANPQVNATATAVVSGSIVTGDTVTLNINQGQVSGGAISVTYTTVAGDTVASLAEGLADLATGAAFNVVPDLEVIANEATITVNWPGPIGNTATLTSSKTGTGSEVLTFNPVGGVLAGGSGPVFAYSNFVFYYNGATLDFAYGQPYSLGNDLIAQMVTQDMPIG